MPFSNISVLNSNFIIADNVEAYHDVWVLGDTFLKETVNSLIALNNSASSKNCTPPYLFQQYNVKPFYNVKTSAARGLACLLNPLLEALNEQARLPKYIIMIPDKDIIVETKSYGFGASYILASAIYFLIRQMEMLLKRCRIDLKDKNRGAVIQENYPKIIWSRMLKRPNQVSLLGQSKTIVLRGRFNTILEECLFEGPDNLHLISIEVDEADFDLTGFLTSTGKETFWKEMDHGFKKFDLGEIKLLPRGNNSNKAIQKNKHADQSCHASCSHSLDRST